MDSNRGSLVSEATALPTQPQPLPYMCLDFCQNAHFKDDQLKHEISRLGYFSSLF